MWNLIQNLSALNQNVILRILNKWENVTNKISLLGLKIRYLSVSLLMMTTTAPCMCASALWLWISDEAQGCYSIALYVIRTLFAISYTHWSVALCALYTHALIGSSSCIDEALWARSMVWLNALLHSYTLLDSCIAMLVLLKHSMVLLTAAYTHTEIWLFG